MPDTQFFIQRLPDALDLPLPAYMTEFSAGMDLYANVKNDTVIKPGKTALIPTGIRIALPCEYEAQIRPRSGLALMYAVSIPNSPGTIDADYRGEIKVILINHGTDDFIIKRGERIAQMVVCPVVKVVWEETEDLPESNRGAGGFGHTGV